MVLLPSWLRWLLGPQVDLTLTPEWAQYVGYRSLVIAVGLSLLGVTLPHIGVDLREVLLPIAVGFTVAGAPTTRLARRIPHAPAGHYYTTGL